MIKGFIFDLDGVLTDTAEYHYRGWKRLVFRFLQRGELQIVDITNTVTSLQAAETA